MKKRHLRDLYVRGTIHTVDDGEGGVTVYLKKLNLTENEEAIRRANAARSIIIAAQDDPESDLYKAALGEAHDSTRTDLIEYMISGPLADKRESVAAEVAARPEWSDNDYLQGLNDAWTGGLKDKYQENPEDEEVKPVFEALKRYGDEVDQLIEGEAIVLRRDMEMISDQELREKAVKSLLKDRADLTWVDAYRKAELLMAVRDPDNTQERYFEELSDLDDLETPVILDLLRAYREMTVEPQEGKD